MENEMDPLWQMMLEGNMALNLENGRLFFEFQFTSPAGLVKGSIEIRPSMHARLMEIATDNDDKLNAEGDRIILLDIEKKKAILEAINRIE